MSSYTDTKRQLAERARILRQAYRGQNGYSMSEADREAYRQDIARANIARRAQGKRELRP